MRKPNFSKITNWFFPMVSILVVILGIAFVVYPWGKDAWGKKQEVVVQKQRLNEKLLPKLQMLSQIDEEETKSNLAKIDLVLPSFPQVPLLMQILEQVAQDSGVKLKALQFSQAAAQSTETETKSLSVNLTLAVFGDWAQVSGFLKNLEKTGRVMKVETLKLSFSEEEGMQGFWATLSVLAPYQPIPEDLGPVDRPLEEFTVKDSEVLAKIEELKVYTVVPEETGAQVQVGKESLF